MTERICEEKSCTGCLSCFRVCPQKAISVFTDTMGFSYPLIDESKCIDCRICTKHCHILTKVSRNKFDNKIYRYAGVDNVRKESSSGGFIPILVEDFYKRGYYICGVIFSDDFLKTKFVVTRSIEIIKKMRKSKYVSAEFDIILNEVKGLLNKNEKVLFVGLPCQVAALKLFCNWHSNLVTIDLICHGNGSPNYYKEGLQSFCKKNNRLLKEVKSVDFRPKPEKKGTHCFNVGFDDVTIQVDSREFPYYYGFNERLLLRASCYDCKYYDANRVGDITVGDSTFADSELGESIVIGNTVEGKEIIQNMLPRGGFIEIEDNQYEELLKRFRKKSEPKMRKKISKAKSYASLEKTHLNYKYVPIRYKIKRTLLSLLKGQ